LLDQTEFNALSASDKWRLYRDASAQVGLFQIQINSLVKDAQCKGQPLPRRVPPKACDAWDCECCNAWTEVVEELQEREGG
jgi:hypothetical protein